MGSRDPWREAPAGLVLDKRGLCGGQSRGGGAKMKLGLWLSV